MSDTAPQRFMFSTSFDPEAMREEREKKAAPTFNEEQMAVVKEQSYNQGFVAGKEAALRDIQSQQNELLSHIQIIFERMADELWKAAPQRRQAVMDVSLSIARKIVPDYVRRSGHQEILAVIEETVTEMIHEPRMVLRISDMQFDDISKEMDALTARVGYAGKMIILAENTLAPNDCRLEWADGGMERSVNLIWSDVEKQMQRHQAHSESPPASPNASHLEARATPVFV